MAGFWLFITGLLYFIGGQLCAFPAGLVCPQAGRFLVWYDKHTSVISFLAVVLVYGGIFLMFCGAHISIMRH